jgi:hypothetical protein
MRGVAPLGGVVMTRHGWIMLISMGLIVILVVFLGCSEDIIFGTAKKNNPPKVWLSSGPVEGDTTGYQVHFYWGGFDPDGEISFFEFVVVDGDPIGFKSEDTTGYNKWFRTFSYDSLFKVTADASPRDYGGSYTRYDKTHTFFIRAVDMEGLRSKPAYRSFTAWTLAPTAAINRPVSSGGLQTYSRIITFGWSATDPIDEPGNIQDPDSVRYMHSQVVDTEGIYDPTFDIVMDLNENPWRYQDKWSPWISYRAPEDSGRVTILGDDEILEINKSYVFAVQAKDEAGAVTAIFTRDVNIRQFIVSWKAGPLLTVTEPFLGGFKFLGYNLVPSSKDLPPEVPLNFKWTADASSYGGEVLGYRYGWDVQDPSDPSDWEVPYSPFNRTAPERSFYSGSHTFYIEAIDNAGTVTLGQIMINVIQFSMERNLLWVDDFIGASSQPPQYETPSEAGHDDFWLGICSRAVDFIPERDEYDCLDHNNKPPEIRSVGKYKNIIWVYSSTSDAWRSIVRFMPESQITEATQLTVNYLSLFLAKGGHLWTLGRSDRGGGLAAVFPVTPLFPVSFKCEITGNQDGCEGDTSGVNCMPYRDYCVTILDKVSASFRTGIEVPIRRLSIDALRHIFRDDSDPVTALYPGMPSTVKLWEEVTKSGRFFDPQVRGFPYVEIYDPEYWMNTKFVESQSCFHPLFRMRTRSTYSPVDSTVVGIWVTKYGNIVPDVDQGVAVAAKSFHFGFPLWFFNRAAADSIVNVVFSEWGINKE